MVRLGYNRSLVLIVIHTDQGNVICSGSRKRLGILSCGSDKIRLSTLGKSVVFRLNV